MEKFQDLSDRDLMLRASTDREYLSALVDRYSGPLYSFVYRFVGRREIAEDIVQETFVRCLKHRRKCPPIQYVSTWLYTIAANLAKTELRRRKRWISIPIDGDETFDRQAYHEPVDHQPLPDAQTETNATKRVILSAIRGLPEEFRESVLLRDLNGLAYEEISNILQVPIGTVKSRVNRGRLRLRRELAPLRDEVMGAVN